MWYSGEREGWPLTAHLTSVIHQIFGASICTNVVRFGTIQDGPFLIPKQLLHFLPRPFIFLDSRLDFLVGFASGSLQFLLELLLFFPRHIIYLTADVLLNAVTFPIYVLPFILGAASLSQISFNLAGNFVLFNGTMYVSRSVCSLSSHSCCIPVLPLAVPGKCISRSSGPT